MKQPASDPVMLYPLVFAPLLKERVWGGRKLADLYGKPVPLDRPIGESWEITDRPEGVSVIADGPLAGRDLRWLMEHHGEALLGRPVRPGERFPWLIKLLDASDDLSLQVHPPAIKASALGGEPKTELWFIAEAAAGAKLHTGLRRGVTRDEFERRTRDGTVAGCFHVHHVARGDAMVLPSGRVHALGAGNVVFEIQQNSDTTYRVFDWNRVGLDGRPRELHLESSFAAIDFFDSEPQLVTSRPEPTSPGVATRALVRDPLFDIDHVKIAAGAVSEGRWPGGLSVVGVVGGSLVLDPGTRPVRIHAGGFVLLPAALPETTFRAEGPTEFLRVIPGE